MQGGSGSTHCYGQGTNLILSSDPQLKQFWVRIQEEIHNLIKEIPAWKVMAVSR